MSEIISNISDFQSDMIDIENNTIKTDDFVFENNSLEKNEIDKTDILTSIKVDPVVSEKKKKYNNLKSVLNNKKNNKKKNVTINDNCKKIEEDAKQFINYQNKVINECSNQSLELVDLLHTYERENKIINRKLMFLVNEKNKIEEECNSYKQSQQSNVVFLCVLLFILLALCVVLMINSKYFNDNFSEEKSKWD